MAINGVSVGKFTLKELDPNGDEFSENLAYVKLNLAGTDTKIADVSKWLATFSTRLVALTDNQLKSANVSYDVGLDLNDIIT